MASVTSNQILQRLLKLHPKLIDLSLNRMTRLLEVLDNPERHLPPVVHIAGTNGKGSVLAFLHSLLEAHGIRVHAYSSPHLCDFHERIYLRGQPIDEDLLNDCLTRCETANGSHEITFFEITTCAAFLAFSETPADVLLLETGLGGRLDATNVIDKPFLTIFTPIAMDHRQYLGETIEQIAEEKAGIIKSGVPCISAQQPKAVEQILQQHIVKKHAGFFWRQGEDFEYEIGNESTGQWHYNHKGKRRLTLAAPGLAGRHQYQNAACALAAAHHLEQRGMLEMNPDRTADGLQNVHWPGRLQRIDDLWKNLSFTTTTPEEVWLDGGHNALGAEALRDFFSVKKSVSPMPLYVIVAMLDSKKDAGFLEIIAPVVTYGIAVTLPDEPAAADAVDLSLAAQKHGVPFASEISLEAAVTNIEQMVSDYRFRVLITGSLYFAGHILKNWQ